MISYSTNFMGPISMDWYRERGLTCMITEVCDSELVASVLGIKVGDTYKYEDITTSYYAGRIDIYGVPGEDYPLEYGLPAMHVEDWYDFSGWLEDFETHELWEFDDIIAQYEQERDTKIRWADKPQQDIEQPRHYVLEVQKNDEGQYIEIPESELDALGWEVGDNLEWKDRGDGSWSLEKIAK